MARELRQRKPHQQPAPPAAPKAKVAKSTSSTGKTAAAAKKKVTEAVAKVAETVAPGATSEEEDKSTVADNSTTKAEGSGKGDSVGDKIELEGFGGDIETNEGVKTSLKELLEESEAGVVLFTYPKASTPGCTKQVCFFRDSYTDLTATGLRIYGLSADSPKANTTFKTKQNLPYPLLCDTKGGLIKAIGLGKAGGKTQRGVWVVGKDGVVKVAEAGGPEATMVRVRKLVEEEKK